MTLFLLATEITAGKGGKAVPEGGFQCENKNFLFNFFANTANWTEKS